MLESVGFKLPKTVLERRVLPLFIDQLTIATQTALCLKAIFITLRALDSDSFVLEVFGKIAFLFNTSDAEIKYLLIKEFNFLLEKLPQDTYQSKLVNLLKSGLSSQVIPLQVASLLVFRENLDNSTLTSMCTAIYPALKECFLKSSTIEVRVTSILALSDILKYMKNQFNLSDMIVHLCNVSPDQPATALSILGTLREALRHCREQLDPQLIALKVVPYLLANTQKVSLNAEQLNMHFLFIDKFLALLKKKTLDSIQITQESSEEVGSGQLKASNEQNTVNFLGNFDPFSLQQSSNSPLTETPVASVERASVPAFGHSTMPFAEPFDKEWTPFSTISTYHQQPFPPTTVLLKPNFDILSSIPEELVSQPDFSSIPKPATFNSTYWQSFLPQTAAPTSKNHSTSSASSNKPQQTSSEPFNFGPFL